VRVNSIEQNGKCRLRDPLAELCRVFAPIAIVVLIAGCASQSRAPVEDRAPLSRARPPAPGTAVPAPAAQPGTMPGGAAQSYVVKRGDTLFQIALDFGLDYKELAAWNGIENPNVILVGQVLRVTAPGEGLPGSAGAGVTTSALRTVPPVPEAKTDTRVAAVAPAGATPAAPALPRNADNYKSSPKAVKEKYSEQAMRDVARSGQPAAEVVASATPAMPAAATPAPPVVPATPAPVAEHADARTELPKAVVPPSADADDDDRLDWVWPAKGKVVSGYSETANLKGIDIAGTAGDGVFASAAGKVVYAGSGLRGYGKLVIVKHNKTWLSAYAYNREILVKEGQQVTKGQKIAEMGNTDTDQVKLHFEIRRLGKPVDPARYLPAG
jgi:lipoprotein NlpD